MVLNLGIDYRADGWKTCLMDHGGPVELSSFSDSPAMLAYVQHICARYPEPTIAIASDLNTHFAALHTQSEQQLDEMTFNDDNAAEGDRFKEVLIAIGSLNLRSYSIPAVAYLHSIPAYRRLNRADMGSAGTLCAITTILARMREREAAWSEMRFLYLEVGHVSKSIVVVEDGCIINGTGTQEYPYRSNLLDRIDGDASVEAAFWEGLTQDLAGLMAIHHFEDIVIREQSAAQTDMRRKDAVIERLGEHYQLYTFPRYESGDEAYDIAIGAALIAQGLAYDGSAADVVGRLRIGEATGNELQKFARAERAPLHVLPQAEV